MRRAMLGVLVGGVCAMLGSGAALARPNYRQVFLKNYEVKADSKLALAGCNVCHVGSDKKNRNVYGRQLQKALGKTQASDVEILDAMKKVEKISFADLIKGDAVPGDVQPGDAPK